MKRTIQFILLITAIMVYPLVIFAASMTTTISSATFTATLTATGGVQQYDASLRNRSNGAVAASMTWTGVAAGNPGYKVGLQYIMVNSTITTIVGWRMNIYTDNLTVTSGFHPYH